MESVWWVFKSVLLFLVGEKLKNCHFVFSRELYSKGLVYGGYKVMPFSTKCNTPVSNFEAGQNYQDVDDPAGLSINQLMNQSIFSGRVIPAGL